MSEGDHSGSPASAAPTHTHGQTLIVRIAILATALVFLFTVGLIFYQWAVTDMPSGTLIVQANQAWDGAVVVVEGFALPAEMRGTIGQERNYRVQFFLHPGSYRVSIYWRDEVVGIREFDIPPQPTGFRYDLSHLEPPDEAGE